MKVFQNLELTLGPIHMAWHLLSHRIIQKMLVWDFILFFFFLRLYNYDQKA